MRQPAHRVKQAPCQARVGTLFAMHRTRTWVVQPCGSTRQARQDRALRSFLQARGALWHGPSLERKTSNARRAYYAAPFASGGAALGRPKSTMPLFSSFCQRSMRGSRDRGSGSEEPLGRSPVERKWRRDSGLARAGDAELGFRVPPRADRRLIRSARGTSKNARSPRCKSLRVLDKFWSARPGSNRRSSFHSLL